MGKFIFDPKYLPGDEENRNIWEKVRGKHFEVTPGHLYFLAIVAFLVGIGLGVNDRSAFSVGICLMGIGVNIMLYKLSKKV